MPWSSAVHLPSLPLMHVTQMPALPGSMTPLAECLGALGRGTCHCFWDGEG